MRALTPILALTLVASLGATACDSPCESEIASVRDAVVDYAVDADPFTPGLQACVTNPADPNYDEFCDLALKATSTRWPYYDCTSCDAVEISLCSCFSDQTWISISAGAADANQRIPKVPGLIYCLANTYRMRSLCECRADFCLCDEPDQWIDSNTGACMITVDGNPPKDVYVCSKFDCYDGTGTRQCDPEHDSPLMTMPNLQQTDTCDALQSSFACGSFDADLDGVPDQYDGTQTQGRAKLAMAATCVGGPPSAAEWQQWHTAPLSLFAGGRIYIEASGCGAAGENDDMDVEDDGVGDTCDNCPATPNGFECDRLFNGAPLNRLRCDVDKDGYATDAEMALGGQLDSDGDGVGDACDDCPTKINPDQTAEDYVPGTACADEDTDVDGRRNPVDTCWNLFTLSTADSDGDGLGDDCDSCPQVANSTQFDGDDDGVGYACDNCRLVSNPDQADTDADGLGDLCDP
ncbi:MAG TPA: thrombospondin type 3 repeat-containing protein [Myxococcota bacterium]|nr:thrombospondin type 3 repeat-containing protein [Myxococcota bacterium]HRY92017.1 thrombospondin type 3 repeat-containing protein [Myxococcota bacterium]HSA21845.1 thrombospondin type 3 repeat-containing protein [Myxococcota bacterium]